MFKQKRKDDDQSFDDNYDYDNDETYGNQKRLSPWKYIGAIILIALITAGIIFVIRQITSGKDNRKVEVTVTVEEIKEIAQLATVEYTISEVGQMTVPKEWFEWDEAQFLVILAGKISGNIDLDKMNVDIVRNNDKMIANLNFQEGAILIKYPQVGPGNLRIITIKDPNLLNRINDSHRNQAFNCAFSNMLSAAEQQGIRKKTAAEAQLVLKRFLHSVGIEANITFVNGDLEPKQIDTNSCNLFNYIDMTPSPK